MSSNTNHPNDNVPLMFRAQVEGRCQLQSIDNYQENSKVWIREWTKYYLHYKTLKSGKPFPTPPPWKQLFQVKPPHFPDNVYCREYTQNWRFLTNSGQDETIARPVFGTKGYPFYPGSSMKGAFRRACENKTERERYCGRDRRDLSKQDLANLPEGTSATKPGILRFHGGYPTNADWSNTCIDIIHPQQDKQIKQDDSPDPKVQIALKNVTWRFGISSSALINEHEWQRIWEIWERALSFGLGSRVSAGYGYFKGYSPKENQQLLEVHLRGSGVASKLLDGTPELRSNTFKASLRGHTLRLLGGMTNPKIAEQLTNQLWGRSDSNDSNNDEVSATVGLLGVFFKEPEKYPFSKHYFKSPKGKKTSIDRYNFEESTLTLFLMSSCQDPQQRKQLLNVATAIVQFAMLLGGFGKSWRRIDHHKFYHEYVEGNPPSKPAIGCHWEFCETSNEFYVPINQLTDVGTFIDQVRETICNWAKEQLSLGNEVASKWREAWFRDRFQNNGVQVWGRIAQSEKDSQAVKWFHFPYQKTNQETYSIKKNFAGKTGKNAKTGRIWHRMYPRYQNGKLTGEYVELLTLFPDSTDNCRNFIDFLQNNYKNHGFKHLW